MASQLFFSLVVCVSLTWQGALSQNSHCDIRSVPRVAVDLSKFVGTWNEYSFVSHSEGIVNADQWTDASETYTLDDQESNKLKITYMFRDPSTKRCATIESSRYFSYKGNGEFALRKWEKDYTYFVARIDRSYQNAVTVACSNLFSNGSCAHMPDVKVWYRGQTVPSGFDSRIAAFFRANIPCVNYLSLTSTSTNNPCTEEESVQVPRFVLRREVKWWSVESFRQMMSTVWHAIAI